MSIDEHLMKYNFHAENIEETRNDIILNNA